ncbi:hypothetical protein FGG08_006091 [Glutinoglossum americanum]|uniref:Ubiquitin-conjugating enzyme E2C-binding protein n=1 Tax=Glutinoglossum americanum TaxID=1670608 RepID=A0A9P8HWT7_9PEZI|nr:hypothetical protein FGG08_006091 [Glutinoglossum americanum]
MESDISSGDVVGKPLSPLSSPSGLVVIYAELLLNIRQVSVFISLPTLPSPGTRAELSPDRLSFTITHDGRVSTLQLPAKVAELPPLKLSAAPNKELSFRLPLDRAVNQASDVGSDNVAPWAAGSLAATTSISCRNCKIMLMEARTVKIWKDLPSENWAEMMEFWHCHKPGDHSYPSENDHVGKGYTAGEKITAESGVGLVDLCYFLLSEQDCSGVKIAARTTTKRQPRILACAACQTIVGATDERAEGWRLYKWSLAVQPTDDIAVERFPADPFISAHLLALIETEGGSKFIVETDEGGGATPIVAPTRYESLLSDPQPTEFENLNTLVIRDLPTFTDLPGIAGETSHNELLLASLGKKASGMGHWASREV